MLGMVGTLKSSEVDLGRSELLAHLLLLGSSDPIKVRMAERLLRRQPVSWIHSKQALHEVEGSLAHLANISPLESLWL